MIARMSILMPFSLTIPQSEELKPIDVQCGPYPGRILPPRVSAITFSEAMYNADLSAHDVAMRVIPAAPQPLSAHVQSDGAPTFQANLFQMEVRAAEFDRSLTATAVPAAPPPPSRDGDPAIGLMFDVANQFLSTIRTVTRGDRIQILKPSLHPWRLDYLTDQGDELEQQEGKHRRRFAKGFDFYATPLGAEGWNLCSSLGPAYSPPGWDVLLLDAISLFPDVDASIALANAALETFAKWLTDSLCELAIKAEREKQVDSSLCRPLAEIWHYTTHRDDPFQRPSIDDHFDKILKILSGRSLKDEPSLWVVYKKLRKARNEFSHQGKPMIGGNEVTVEETGDLLRGAVRIVEWGESLLPEKMHRPRQKLGREISFAGMLGPA